MDFFSSLNDWLYGFFIFPFIRFIYGEDAATNSDSYDSLPGTPFDVTICVGVMFVAFMYIFVATTLIPSLVLICPTIRMFLVQNMMVLNAIDKIIKFILDFVSFMYLLGVGVNESLAFFECPYTSSISMAFKEPFWYLLCLKTMALTSEMMTIVPIFPFSIQKFKNVFDIIFFWMMYQMFPSGTGPIVPFVIHCFWLTIESTLALADYAFGNSQLNEAPFMQLLFMCEVGFNLFVALALIVGCEFSTEAYGMLAYFALSPIFNLRLNSK